jgi:glyoxylase-like metal-dependent hydrolase (beta-lactamase superfamily II)
VSRLTEAAAGVLVATSEIYVTTSTVVIGPGGRCLVIDPAVTVPDLRLLAADLAAAALHPVAGFATLPHWDHVLWSRNLGDVPRYAAERAVQTAARWHAEFVSAVQETAPGHDLDLLGRLSPLPPGSGRIPWDGPAALIATHDGHAPGHSAVFLPGTGTLVAGDMCSDIEIPLLDLDQPDPVGDYRAGLAKLAALPVTVLVPGHGTVCDGDGFRRRLAADLRYLDGLEAGREPADPRLTGWLADQHLRQLRHLHGVGDGG